MKNKDLVELRAKDAKSLEKLLLKKRLEFSKAKAEIKVAREKNLKKAKNLANDISQILTITREKQLSKEQLNNKESKAQKE